MATGGHTKYLISEFPFGSNHRADFVLAFSYSGTWELHFIELESPDDQVITRSGKVTQAFNSAISQIGDWRMWVEQNPVLIRKDVSDWCMKRDLLKPAERPHRPPSNFSGDRSKTRSRS